VKPLFILALAGRLMVGTLSAVAGPPETQSRETETTTGEAFVQIFGRMCEYHREDVEAALRSFKIVRQVEFLNDHGTVLVRYEPSGETPEQFADAVDRALAAGWNCSARVDRGERTLVTN
jgi:hypothetical protein